MQYQTISVRAVIRDVDSILVEWVDSMGISFLPGGTVEAGEDLRSALERELREEVAGTKFNIGRYRGKIGHVWRVGNATNSCLNHFYDVTLVEGSNIQAKETGRILCWLALKGPALLTLQPPSLRDLLRTNGETAWNLTDGLQ